MLSVVAKFGIMHELLNPWHEALDHFLFLIQE